MEKQKDIPPPVISADEAAFRAPPPSYEEIMGVYQTSIKAAPTGKEPRGAEIPTLSYIDIMPRCLSPGNIAGKIPPKFENFSCILNAANFWLQNNPGLAVWKCECVDKRLNAAKDGSISYELNAMLRPEPTFGYLVYIKGLRLWLTRSSGGPTQQLGLRNIVPEKVTINLPVHHRGYYRPGSITVAGQTQTLAPAGVLQSLDTFEGLAGTIKRLKEKLKKDPIPGTILTIETDKVKAYEQFKKDLDPEGTCWVEDKDKFRRFTQVLRIFYVTGSPANEEIEYEEFVPELVEKPDPLKPGKLQTYDMLMHRLAGWVASNQGIRIINIQQYNAKVNKYLDTVEIESNSTDDVLSTFQDQRFAMTLRVFYTRTAAVRGIPANFMSCRLFLPARTGKKSFECMTQTMDRIDAWLRVTGLPVYSVDTVELLFNEVNPAGAECTKTDYISYSVSGKSWLTAIRVFFSTPYQEPDPTYLPPLPVYSAGSGGGSSTCNIL